MFNKLLCILLLFFVKCSYAQQVYFLESAGLNVSIDASVIYTMDEFAQNGSVLLGDEVLTDAFFYDFVGLNYLPDDPYAFAYVNVSENMVQYDNFSVLAYVRIQDVTTVYTINIPLTLIDAEVNNVAVNTSVIVDMYCEFQVTVADFKDRVGLEDGIVSFHAFRSPGTDTLLPNSGIEFNETCTLLGCVVSCMDNSTLVPNIVYPTADFCFMPNSTLERGFDMLRYSVVGTNGTVVGDDAYLLLSTSNVDILCDPCEVEMNENVAYNFSAIDLFNITTETVDAEYWLVVTRDVDIGSVVDLNGTILLTNSSQCKYPCSLQYIPEFGYFNRYMYADNTTSSTFSLGSPIEECEVPRASDGVCTVDFSFQLLVDTGEVFGPVNVQIVIDRSIAMDTMSTCTTCLVSGNQSRVDIVLEGEDGRLIPEPMFVIHTLPLEGILLDTFGDPISPGDVITDRNLIYLPQSGYFNRYLYLSEPESVVSLRSQYGEFIMPEDYDTFTYSTMSSYYPDTNSTQSILEIEVAFIDETQVTSCPIGDVDNPWESSCIAFGTESNALYAEYATPIYLNVANVNGSETLSYFINQMPIYGTLYTNLGNFTDPEIGPIVSPLTAFSTNMLVYVGYQDYCNRNDDSYLNKNGDPLGGCVSFVDEIGCPDSFKFYGSTDMGRISNNATYQVYIMCAISEPVVTSPERIQVEINVSTSVNITYTDPDLSVYTVVLQLLGYDMLYGITGDMPVHLSASSSECFNTTGCNGTLDMYMLDSDVADVLTRMYVVMETNVTLLDEEFLSISVIKRPPYGFDPFVAYAEQPDDITFPIDIQVYVFDDYDEDYYDEDVCEVDDCEGYYNLTNLGIDNDQIMKQNNLILLVVGIMGGTLAFVATFFFFRYLCGWGGR